MPPETVAIIGVQALKGLAAAHEARIVHRDIKPSNLFLARQADGTRIVKLLDFGIAKVQSDPAKAQHSAGMTATGDLLGSPLYMSPEQVMSTKDVDARSDLWSLGSVLYCALAGFAPHIESSAAVGRLLVTICSKPIPPLRERAPWVPESIAQVVAPALERAPEQRYPSAASMVEALAPHARGGTLHEGMLTPANTGEYVVVRPARASLAADGNDATLPVNDDLGLAATKLVSAATNPVLARGKPDRRKWLAGIAVAFLLMTGAFWALSQNQSHESANAGVSAPILSVVPSGPPTNLSSAPAIPSALKAEPLSSARCLYFGHVTGQGDDEQWRTSRKTQCGDVGFADQESAAGAYRAQGGSTFRAECKGRMTNAESSTLPSMRFCLMVFLGPSLRANASAQRRIEPARHQGASGRAFERGIKYFDAGSLELALTEFLESRRLYPLRTATANAIVCMDQLARHDEALEMVEVLLRDFGATMPVDARERAQRKLIELRQRVGTIEIASAKVGSTILIDGRERGQYPLLEPLRVKAGGHLLRVIMLGFEPFETQVDIAGNGVANVEVNQRALVRSGALSVVEQAGKQLDVVVDGVIVGKTPWQGVLPLGEHIVLLRGEGRLGTLPTPITLAENKTTQISLVAEVFNAQLRIEPSPANAMIALDGITLGRGVWEGALRAGEHRIEVTAPDFMPQARKVTIGQDEHKTSTLVLQRDPRSLFAIQKPHFIFDGNANLALAPTFGGDENRGVRGDWIDAYSQTALI